MPSHLLRPPPHVFVFAWKRIFFSRFGLSCSRIRLKRAPKTHLFKTISRIEIFKTSAFRLRVDGGFWIRWWHTSYTSRMTHAQSGILSYFHRFSVFVYTEEKDSNTLRVHAYFLKTEEKSLRFQKYPDTCGRGLNCSRLRCGAYSRAVLIWGKHLFEDATKNCFKGVMSRGYCCFKFFSSCCCCCCLLFKILS